MSQDNKQKKKQDEVKDDEKDIKDVKKEIVVEQEGELTELKKQAEENLDGWKRCQADFENYKKMQSQAQKDFIKYSGQNIVLQIIPVLDNFHMATDHIPEDQKDGGWVVGIMHIQKQLENVLAENGVNEIETKEGDKFDPEIHEAIENNEQGTIDKEQKNEISKIILKGYKLNGKVIRAVKVIVE